MLSAFFGAQRDALLLLIGQKRAWELKWDGRVFWLLLLAGGVASMVADRLLLNEWRFGVPLAEIAWWGLLPVFVLSLRGKMQRLPGALFALYAVYAVSQMLMIPVVFTSEVAEASLSKQMVVLFAAVVLGQFMFGVSVVIRDAVSKNGNLFAWLLPTWGWAVAFHWLVR